MDSNWFVALVVILGTMLGLFLVLSIVLIVKLIQIANTAKRITEQAEAVAERAEHISAFFEKSAAPVALFKLMTNIGESFYKKARKAKEK